MLLKNKKGDLEAFNPLLVTILAIAGAILVIYLIVKFATGVLS
jgi:hypothetical protein